MGDALIHASRPAGRGVGWLVPLGLISISGVFSGMSGPPVLCVLCHPRGRWPGFSHQSAVFHEGDDERRLLKPRAGKSHSVMASVVCGSQGVTGQPGCKGQKHRLRPLTGGSSNLWSRGMGLQCPYTRAITDHPLFSIKPLCRTYFH